MIDCGHFKYGGRLLSNQKRVPVFQLSSWVRRASKSSPSATKTLIFLSNNNWHNLILHNPANVPCMRTVKIVISVDIIGIFCARDWGGFIWNGHELFPDLKSNLVMARVMVNTTNSWREEWKWTQCILLPIDTFTMSLGSLWSHDDFSLRPGRCYVGLIMMIILKLPQLSSLRRTFSN